MSPNADYDGTPRRLRDLGAAAGRLEAHCREAVVREAAAGLGPDAADLKRALSALADLDRATTGAGAAPDPEPERREVVEHLLRFRHGRALALAAYSARAAGAPDPLDEWTEATAAALARVKAELEAFVARA